MVGIRRLAGAVALTASVALVSACGAASSSSSAATGGTPTSEPATASSSAQAPGAPATSAPANTAPAATPPAASSGPAASTSPGNPGPTACSTKSLDVNTGEGEGAAGSLYQTILFTNTSGAACTLYGYPGVALASGTVAAAAGSTPTQVGAAATRSTMHSPAVVTLQPGQTANALLRIVTAGNYPESTCSPAPTNWLQIYPPNETKPVYLAFKSTGCAKTSVNLLTIDVVQPGKVNTP